MDERERNELLDALVERLNLHGAPQGIWLVEIAQARDQLQAVDSLLRRLYLAIVETMPPLT